MAEAAAAFWATFDLDSRRLALDTAGLELQTSKEASTASRKLLATATQEFKRRFAALGSGAAPAAAGEEDAPTATTVYVATRDLLRPYQAEVDALTRRARAADNAFFGLYKSLYEAPDPAPVLRDAAAAKARAAAAELGADRLAKELKEYEEEIGTLKNQDITIRELQARLEEHEEQAGDAVEAAARKRAAAGEASAAARAAEAEARLRALERSLASAGEALAEAQGGGDRLQRQLADAAAKADEKGAAWAAEREILALDAERSRAALAEAEAGAARRKAAADGAAASAAAGGGGGAAADSQAAARAEATLKETVAGLRRELGEQERQWATRLQEGEAVVERAREASARASAEAAALREELSSRPAMAEVEYLRRRVGGGGGGGDDAAAAADAGAAGGAGSGDAGGGGGGGGSLAARLRSLEAEAAVLKRAAAESRAEAERHKAAAAAAAARADERAAAVKRLEDQLTRAGKPGGGGGALSEFVPGGHGGDESSLAAPGADALALGVIAAQRDRFRTRIDELENEREDARTTLTESRRSLDQLRRDNLTLYEKIRYLQDYKLGGAAPSGQGTREVSASAAEARYRGQYEESRNPFNQFTKVEQNRKYAELSVADKITINTARMVMATSFGRTFVLAYLGIMHLLIFITGTHLVHSTGCHGNVAPQTLPHEHTLLRGGDPGGPLGGVGVG